MYVHKPDQKMTINLDRCQYFRVLPKESNIFDRILVFDSIIFYFGEYECYNKPEPMFMNATFDTLEEAQETYYEILRSIKDNVKIYYI